MANSIAWTIGGSDSGGGAGIQADIKTMAAFGVHGCSVVSALTAQNTAGVGLIQAVSDSMLQEQLHALKHDLPPRAIKIGMLASQQSVETVVNFLEEMRANLDNGQMPFIVCDPVMVATSGNHLVEPDAVNILRRKLMPIVDLITPNLPEAERLTGIKESHSDISNQDELDQHFVRLADRLLHDGAKAVLIKGGHSIGEYSQDYFADGNQRFWFTSRRAIAKPFHGTGCTLSSAIASTVAKGETIINAIVLSKAYINQAIATAPGIGSLTIILGHFKSVIKQEQLPWATLTASEGRNRTTFEPDRKLGFYPIVNRAQKVIELIHAGATTIQLRIKNLDGIELESEIESASKAAKNAKVRLYVNDYWREALRYRAYGVHLGQGDLDSADVPRIQNDGLRLGISTHNHFEVSRALSFRPSYIAIGPIHHTTTKDMPFEPQGVEGFAYWAGILKYPLVAIGGVFLDNAKGLIDAGADGVAVVRDIVECSDKNERTRQWLGLFS